MVHTPSEDRPFEVDRQRFLRVALAVLITVTGIVALAPLIAPDIPWPWNQAVALAVGGAAAFYIIAYWLNERGKATQASRWLVVGVVAGSLAPILVPGGMAGTRSYAFILANVLISAFILSWRSGALVAAFDGAAFTALAATRPAYAAGPFLEDMLLLAILSTLILTFAAYSELNRRRSRSSQTMLREVVSDLQAMLDNCPDAIMTIRFDGTVLRYNGVAAEWGQKHLGARIERGASLRQFTGPIPWGRVAPLLERAATTGATSGELAFEAPGGTRWVVLHLRAIEGSEGTFAAQLRDVTQARTAEQKERAAYRDALELEKLRDIDRLRTRLLNVASHEMRTPLTPMRLQLGVLERRLQGVMDERTAHSLSTIKRNVLRLTMLLDDLLDVSKLESKELHLRLESVSVDSLVSAEAEVHRSAAREKGLRLVVASETGRTIQADPRRLAQVFSNLIKNAIKYGRTEIQVTASSNGDEVTFAVQDDGTGFDPGRAEGLWLPFVQIHDGLRQKDGTGLGLYICKGIVEQHGGRIWADSEGVGRGAKFLFSLPAVATEEPESTAIAGLAAEAAPRTTAPPTVRPVRHVPP